MNNTDNIYLRKQLYTINESDESEENEETEKELYTIQTNMNKSLCESIGIEYKIQMDNYGKYIPPATHGLDNSEFIIKPYYNIYKSPQHMFQINFFDMIKDDIRNYQPLNKHQLMFLENLTHSQLVELVKLYNECVSNVPF